MPLQINLTPHTRYYYRVTVTTDAEESVQSEICWFETAKLDETWKADWIGIHQDNNLHLDFMKKIDITKEVAQARL